ncbi:MiaB/RimO family radical SAM methylthiotransferase [Patescibacteria group bacterium]|nr:MiaB/RimO family radical SAM methylthiotransferase [Patescibacteria group bacterium]
MGSSGSKTYYIQTFGCAANEADSERIASFYRARGYVEARSPDEADDVVINTCMIRQMAEDRVYGLVHNLDLARQSGRTVKIVVTGCMVGMAAREKTGKMMELLRKKMPSVDEFLPTEEVGFDHAPVRGDKSRALVPVSNGCNNFCTFCVVPFTRGREVSRPFDDILLECHALAHQGYTQITLIGQNVNSYGADILKSTFKHQHSKLQVKDQNGGDLKITYVKHLGRFRIPTLFPQLLEEICKIDGIELLDFISSNPWDFSDDLIRVIARNRKISRHIHLPVQSGDNEVLRKMNRWYTREEYLKLISKLKAHISDVTIGTDIIVGFCGETDEQFQNTVDLAKKAGFSKAYVAMYSDRPMTAAHTAYRDDVPYREKKRRWKLLEEMINKKNLEEGTYTRAKPYRRNSP